MTLTTARDLVLDDTTRRDVNARIWRFVALVPGCWEWTGARMSYGYGSFHFGKASRPAHRVMFALVYGAAPAARVIRHTCDNTSCVRPTHLVSGTIADNVADRVARGRGVRTNARLTVALVEEIRTRYRCGGISQRALATEYGVKQATIWRILVDKAWVST